MERNGFTLIEVLIALVILFSAVASFGAAFKMYVDARFKQELYEDFYITALSLKSVIENKKLLDEREGSGELNGFAFTFEAKPIETARNFSYMDTGGTAHGANVGPFELTLYHVNVKLARTRAVREFSFYVTQYKADAALLSQ